MKFGWCMDGHHDDCRHQITRTTSDDTTTYTCSCTCHTEETA